MFNHIVTSGVFFGAPLVFNSEIKGGSENQKQLDKVIQEIDSLKLLEIENRKPKVIPFNPNFISDYKGASLGMSNLEIDRLHHFRKQNQWVYSAKEFQQVTKISDSLLNSIAPYFKFPEWVTHPKPKANATAYYHTQKTFAQKDDLNTATAKQLQEVNGVGAYYSEQILRYRNKFIGGFIDDVQLTDIPGLTPEVIKNITDRFTVKTPRIIKRLDINKAQIEELVTVQFIDYDLAYEIVEQRDLRGGYRSLDELTKVKGFPVNKLEIIKLYLLIEKENI